MIKSSDSDKWRFPVERSLRDLQWGPQRPEKSSFSHHRALVDDIFVTFRVEVLFSSKPFSSKIRERQKKHRNRESYHVQYLGCLFAQHFFLLLKAKHIFDKKPFVPLLLLRRRKKMFLGQRKNLLWAFFVQ